MEVIVILVFISLILVIAGLYSFVVSVRQGDMEHGDRLTLLPLENDDMLVSTDPLVPEKGVRFDD